MKLIKTMKGKDFIVELAEPLAILMLRKHPEYRVMIIEEKSTEPKDVSETPETIIISKPVKRGRKANGK